MDGDGLELIFKCDCGNTSTGSQGFHVDIINGEIVCRACGEVSSNFYWTSKEVYEK